VGDLDDLARAEAGDLKLTIADVDVGDVCRSAIRAANLEGDPRLRLDVASGLSVRGDVVRVRQILVNLLTNADRHTPPDGSIAVSARAQDREAVIDVHNTGSSLTSGEIERVFDRFYRADPSRQRATGGSGLGLAIVKHLTELQAGRVGASSDAAGVTVGVALPRSV
jgi:two-component system sensor histidine kinase BaeS